MKLHYKEKTMPEQRYSKFVFRPADTKAYRFPTHAAKLLMDRSEAETSEAFLVMLGPGEAPPVHVHHDTEQVFYVIQGVGQLQIDSVDGPQFPIASGDLIRIPPGTYHRMQSSGEETLVYLSVDCFLRGRPVDEPTWERHLQAVCAENQWDFSRVRVDEPDVTG
jgi:mannose-6-phosphate isomerase-like protein (cupin superfamily)